MPAQKIRGGSREQRAVVVHGRDVARSFEKEKLPILSRRGDLRDDPFRIPRSCRLVESTMGYENRGFDLP